MDVESLRPGMRVRFELRDNVARDIRILPAGRERHAGSAAATR